MRRTCFRFSWLSEGLIFMVCLVCARSAESASGQTVTAEVVLPALGAAQADPAWDKEDLTRFVDRIMERQMKVEHIPGAAISIVKDGAIVLVRAYGVADVERGIAVNPTTTIFRLGSITKAVTASASR